ncbi:uncharacterized protein LOC131882677 isoform X1 [Tigriopus californicus]|uniref:uncharacterized protein LOC131882677 isoform X1 n=1 Tax=Tigriopus californicus TaxID=6832 RepID=UPI0027DA24BA|nr:uncharacterized protein LOC131882677 isoform X1 [Tigriopus californicus]
MNALENLIFNQALEVTEEAPQKGATSEENDEPAELAERAERGLKDYDEVIAEVPVPTEENKFQHLDLSGLSQKLLNLGDRMKSLKDSIGVMNLPQGEATPLRPSPSPRCRAQDSARDMPGLDDWCRDNCSTGNCPNNLCVCDH